MNYKCYWCGAKTKWVLDPQPWRSLKLWKKSNYHDNPDELLPWERFCSLKCINQSSTIHYGSPFLKGCISSITEIPLLGFAIFVGLAIFKIENRVDNIESKILSPTIVDNNALTQINKNVFFYEELFTGRSVKFYENGLRELEYNWTEGKRDGIEMRWYENGQEKLKKEWRRGKLIKHYEWDEKGKLTKFKSY